MSYPSTFQTSPLSTPESLFRHQTGKLFESYRDPQELLIYTDGSCPDNGADSPRGGCAFVFKCSDDIPQPWEPPGGAYVMHGAFFFRLEYVGPTGKTYEPTSNRAELRAVTAALGPFLRDTLKAGTKLVIATDSEHVVDGATQWCRTWEGNGWKLSDGEDVKNKDLWELLLKRVREMQDTYGHSISLWHIPREENERADRVARYAATLPLRRAFGVPPNGSLPVLVDPSQL